MINTKSSGNLHLFRFFRFFFYYFNFFSPRISKISLETEYRCRAADTPRLRSHCFRVLDTPHMWKQGTARYASQWKQRNGFLANRINHRNFLPRPSNSRFRYFTKGFLSLVHVLSSFFIRGNMSKGAEGELKKKREFCVSEWNYRFLFVGQNYRDLFATSGSPGPENNSIQLANRCLDRVAALHVSDRGMRQRTWELTAAQTAGTAGYVFGAGELWDARLKKIVPGDEAMTFEMSVWAGVWKDYRK